MWELDHKEGWASKNWCFWTVLLEKTLESPLDSKEVTPINPKGNQPWIFFGRTDGEAEAPTFWSPNVKSQLNGKKPWCWERWRAGGEGNKREDEIVGWYYRLSGQEFWQTLGYNERQGSLVCCSSWGHNNWTWLSEWTTVKLSHKFSHCTERYFVSLYSHS